MAKQLQSSIHLSASPASVLAMLCDPDYLALKVSEAQAGEYTVEQDGDFTTTTLMRTSPVELPAMVQSMIGKTITLRETQQWNVSSMPYVATLEINVQGAPARVSGTITLQPASNGTDVVIEATATVAVPIIGKQIENLIAQEVDAALEDEQSIAQTWLNK